MGMLGKYLLKITCANGDVGYFVDVYDGCIELTESIESAEHFMTKNGAKGFVNGTDWDMPTVGEKGTSRVVSVDLITLT